MNIYGNLSYSDSSTITCPSVNKFSIFLSFSFRGDDNFFLLSLMEILSSPDSIQLTSL